MLPQRHGHTVWNIPYVTWPSPAVEVAAGFPAEADHQPLDSVAVRRTTSRGRQRAGEAPAGDSVDRESAG